MADETTKEKALVNGQQVVKMKQGMSYTCKEKTIILNVFKYFKSVHPEKCVTELVRRTAKATGCSEKSIFQFRKEEASVEGFKQPSKTKIRKNININSRFVKYDSNIRERIRSIIYDLKSRNVVPSLSIILKSVNSDEALPNFSLMTLRRLLFDMGFCYEREKVGSKPILVEKQNVKQKNLIINQKKNEDNKNNDDQNKDMQQRVPRQQQSSNYVPNQIYNIQNEKSITQHVNNQHFMEHHNIAMINQRYTHQMHPISHGFHMHKPDNMGFVPQPPQYHHPMII